MSISVRLQLLTCLMLYVSSAQAIMVKFGTKGGPIEPPTPEPSPAPQPYRDPAPVWEERSNDTPDPNAQWRPPLFVPQPRYTNIIINPAAPTPLSLNSAQRFVNAYIPKNRPLTGPPQGSPSILGSQNLPGVGLRYFYPIYPPVQQKPARQEDAKLNQLDADLGASHGAGQEAASDFQWKYEKESTRRSIRNSQEGTARVVGYPVYQFPLYVQPRHR